MKKIIAIPGADEIATGPSEHNNIAGIALTECANSGTELTLGSVCAAMLECTLRTPYGGVDVTEGTELALYEEDDAGNRTQTGLFTLEKPTRKNAHIMSLTAYDRVSWLDRDLTTWLNALTGWPYTLGTFAQMVCEQCGLTLKSTTFPNSDYEVPVFVADGITGRRLMSWVGEIAARFVRADAYGQIELAWYVENHNEITAGGDHFFYQGGLRYEDYQTAAVEKVQIRLSGNDIGVACPGTDGEANTYTITGNYLLTATDPAQLEPVAQTIYEQIKDVRYTPCTVKLPAANDFRAGDIVTITDLNGVSFRTYVMSRVQKGQQLTLESTGSARRSSSTATYEESFRAVNAKMLEIRKSIEGLNVRAANISTSVEENQKYVEEQLAEFDVQADAVRIEVSKEIESVKSDVEEAQKAARDAAGAAAEIQESGVTKVKTAMGYTFDDDGLTIQRPDGEVMNKLDDKGMIVSRASDNESILEATADGVNALNVKARKFLTIGNYSQIADYSDGTDSQRTGIFWIGGAT